MEIGKLEVTIESNLDEYIQLIKKAQEAIEQVNDFELEFEIVQEKKNKERVSFTLDGKELANQ